jgi:hypothetical protein
MGSLAEGCLKAFSEDFPMARPPSPWLFPIAIWVLTGCGRNDRGGSDGKASAENGRPWKGPGHGTGEPGSGYGGQTNDEAARNPPADTTGSPSGPDRATRPGTGNADMR